MSASIIEIVNPCRTFLASVYDTPSDTNAEGTAVIQYTWTPPDFAFEEGGNLHFKILPAGSVFDSPGVLNFSWLRFSGDVLRSGVLVRSKSGICNSAWDYQLWAQEAGTTFFTNVASGTITLVFPAWPEDTWPKADGLNVELCDG